MTSAKALYTICLALPVNTDVSNLRVKHAHHYKIDDSASYPYLSSFIRLTYMAADMYGGNRVTGAKLKT